MPVKDFKVKRVERKDIAGFIEKHHYSGSINGCRCQYCFALYDENDKMIGAAFFGGMAMANQWKRFGDKEEDVIELRRLCCIDETPKNTESFFIGKMLKWLKKNTNLKCVVSYADAEYNHAGTIYKASNFQYLGKRPGARVIVFNGKKYHDKAIRTKYNGRLKPFAQKIKDALDSGAAFYQKTAGKHAFIYKFER